MAFLFGGLEVLLWLVKIISLIFAGVCILALVRYLNSKADYKNTVNDVKFNSEQQVRNQRENVTVIREDPSNNDSDQEMTIRQWRFC